MKSVLHEKPPASSSPLDAAEHVFQLISCEPAGLAVDGRTLGDRLPRRPILLTELRDLLTSRTVTNATRDTVWRELVTRARRDGPQWFVGAVGVAVPALRGIAGRLCRGFRAGDPIDIDTEVLAAFIEGLRTIDLARPHILPRMCHAAYRAGERARQNAEAHVALRIPGHDSKAPAAPWGHPDLVLADAVAKGVVSELDAELIGITRLEKRTLAEAAAELGLTEEAARKRRQRCEPVLVEAVRAGEVEAALSLTITSAAPRRVEETSARSRITSDPQPTITTESKGGWGNPPAPRGPHLLPESVAGAVWQKSRWSWRSWRSFLPVRLPPYSPRRTPQEHACRPT